MENPEQNNLIELKPPSKMDGLDSIQRLVQSMREWSCPVDQNGKDVEAVGAIDLDTPLGKEAAREIIYALNDAVPEIIRLHRFYWDFYWDAHKANLQFKVEDV